MNNFKRANGRNTKQKKGRSFIIIKRPTKVSGINQKTMYPNSKPKKRKENKSQKNRMSDS